MNVSRNPVCQHKTRGNLDVYPQGAIKQTLDTHRCINTMEQFKRMRSVCICRYGGRNSSVMQCSVKKL